MKICFIASTYPRSQEDPAVPWLRENLRRLRDRGHQIEVFAPAFRGCASHEIDGIPVHRFRYCWASKEDLTHDAGAPAKIRRWDYLLLSFFYILAGAWGLARLHRRERFDLIHVHWPFPHGLFGLAAMQAHRASIVLSFHGAELLLAKKFPFVNPCLRVFTRHAQAVTCNSSYTASAINSLGTCAPLVLPYGSPLVPRDVPAPDNAVKTILFVGRLIERKGVEYLLQALPLIQKRLPARLVIVGSGPLLEPLRAQVMESGLTDSVEFRVNVLAEELAQAYAECDAFVLPAIVDSRGDTEGLGVVLIEALSFRRPVVASAVGGIVDVILDDQTGLLVPEKDPSALASALVRVLSDKELAERLAVSGRRHAQRVFDWDRIMDQTEALYLSLFPGLSSSLSPQSERHLRKVKL